MLTKIRAAIALVTVLSASIQAASMAVFPNDPKWLAAENDVTYNWDWTDASWYLLKTRSMTNHQAVPYPFDANNHFGVTVSGDRCAQSDGWRLYIRRVLAWDNVPTGVDPKDPRMNADYQDALQITPFFMLYNINTGVMRSFIYLTPEPGVFPQNGDFVNAIVTIGDKSGATRNALDARIFDHAIFANHSTSGDATTISDNNSSSERVYVSGKFPAAKGRWLVFDVDLNFDPRSAGVNAALYFRVDLEFSSSSAISLNLKGDIDQITQVSKTPEEDAKKINLLQVAIDAGKLVYVGAKNAKSEYQSVESTVGKIESVSSEIAAYLDKRATDQYWKSVNWNSPDLIPVTGFVKSAADVGGSVANWINNAAANSTVAKVSPALGALYSFASSFILGSNSAATPAPQPIKFEMHAKLEGALSWKSCSYPVLANLSGVSATIGGLSGENPSSYPVFAKQYGNPPLGIVGFLRKPRVIVLAARPRAKSIPEWYVAVEDLRNIVSLNKNNGYQIESYSYRFKTSSGAVSPLVDASILLASVAVPTNHFSENSALAFRKGEGFESGDLSYWWWGANRGPVDVNDNFYSLYWRTGILGGWKYFFEEPKIEVHLKIRNETGGVAILKYSLAADADYYDPIDQIGPVLQKDGGTVCLKSYPLNEVQDLAVLDGHWLPFPSPKQRSQMLEKWRRVSPVVMSLLE
jgi:hypothetical protein